MSKDGKVQLKTSMSSSSLKRKRHKSTKHNRESLAAPDDFTLGDTAPPGVNTVKPLVEYDDISSDSDTFSDPPSSRPFERGGIDWSPHQTTIGILAKKKVIERAGGTDTHEKSPRTLTKLETLEMENVGTRKRAVKIARK